MSDSLESRVGRGRRRAGARMRRCLILRQGASPLRPGPLSLWMYCMDSEESVKGSQAAPTRAPLTDSSESGTRFSDEGKGALVQADDGAACQGRAWPGEFFPPF